MTALSRNASNKINKLLETFPAVLIVGVRQCGKTSLSRMLRSDWKYFDLENSNDRRFITADYDFFFREHPKHIIIDEAQEDAELFKNLRGVIDADRTLNNRFILTGSSSPHLLSQASESLAGRVGIVELGTLKQNEFQNKALSAFYQIFQDELTVESLSHLKQLRVPVDQDVIDFFLKGGYPQPALLDDHDAYLLWMQNYLDTYINRDIRRLFPRMDIIKYQRFVRTLSELSGTIVNRAELGRSLDVSEVTIRDYLDIADKTFVWRTIPAYHQSISKSLVKMPKGLVRDSGLCHYLSDVHTREQLIRSPKVGQNFEAFVIEEIIKGVQTSVSAGVQYYFYRTKHGAEVDLVLQGSFGVLPIEIKFSTSTDAKKLSSLKRFLEQENLPFGIVVNNSQEIRLLTDNIIQIPVACL